MTAKYILYYLNRTKKMMHQIVDRQLKEEGFKDLVPSYCDVLTALHLNEGQLKMHEISELVGKDKSTVTVLVNRLIERGYIQKEKSQLDRRVTNIKLTEKSFQNEEVFDRIAGLIKEVAYDGFSEKDERQFMEYLDKMAVNFEQELKK